VIEVARRTVRERWRVLLLGTLFALLAAAAVASGAPAGQAFSSVPMIGVILSIAIVSRDIRTGALPMLLCRPLRRADYLLGRYLGVLALVAVDAGLVLAGAAAAGLRQAAGAGAGALLSGAAGAVLQSALYVAVILMFSTFLPGVGDVILYVLLWLLYDVGYSLERVRSPESAEILARIKGQIFPEPEWSRIFSSGRWLDPQLASWGLALSVSLALAMLVFNRREFGYARD
jgi:ABC-type transport system involved in multi-copper enzyme maturation permease subunit